jgi:hypothetical protein
MESKKSFLLRIEPEMWKQLEKWAQDEFRSVNGQIEYILKQALLKRSKGESPVQQKEVTMRKEDGPA